MYRADISHLFVGACLGISMVVCTDVDMRCIMSTAFSEASVEESMELFVRRICCCPREGLEIKQKNREFLF
jgi:hypothetical protein